MTSLITLNTKADGTFNNYFEDVLTFPPNSEVALVKCLGANIELESYEYLQVPNIDEANREVQIIRLCVDGVNQTISWSDIYTAYEEIVDKESKPAVTEETFFDGSYRWTLNPDTNGNVVQSICRALDLKFTFYDIRPNCETSKDVNYSGQRCYTKFGITSTYSTLRRLKNQIPFTSGDIDNLTAFSGTSTILPGQITTTADDTIVYSTTDIAINGGFLKFKVNDDHECKVGVTFDNLQKVTTGTYSSQGISFGISVNANGPKTYTIIRDGIEENTPLGYNGTDETFYFVFSRVNSPEAAITQTDYTVYLLQGYPGSGENYQNYAVARYNMSDGYSPSFVLDAPSSGTVIDTIQCTRATDEDRECRIFMSNIYTPSRIQSGGTVFRNSHSFILRNSDSLTDAERESTRQFFSDLGFDSFNSSETTTQLEQIVNFSNTENNKLIIPTKCKSKIIFGKLIYLPDDALGIDPEVADEKNPALLSQPPPYLQFHIETFDAVSYEGNFVKGLDSRVQNTTTRILQSIPLNEQVNLTDNVGVVSNLFNYDYEVFNPYYISLNNAGEMKVNQLQGRLVTPNNDIVKLNNQGNVNNTIVVLHVRTAK